MILIATIVLVVFFAAFFAFAVMRNTGSHDLPESNLIEPEDLKD